MQLIHEFSMEIFDLLTLWIGTIILSLILRIQRLKINVEVYNVLVSILNLEEKQRPYAGPFKRNNGLMLVQLKPIPNAEYWPFYR